MSNKTAIVSWTDNLQSKDLILSLLDRQYTVKATLNENRALTYAQKLQASVVIADINWLVDRPCRIKTLDWLKNRLEGTARLLVVCPAEISPDDYAWLHELADILLEKPYPASAIVEAVGALVSLASRTRINETIAA